MSLQYSDYLKAHDTMFFYDFDRLYSIMSQFKSYIDTDSPLFWADDAPDGEDRSKKLIDMIKVKFAMWQVWTMHDALFLDSMGRIFDSYKDYYKEKITAYEVQINFLDGYKVTTTTDMTHTETPRVEVQVDTYDLPRSDSSVNRPSARSISKPISGTNVLADDGDVTRKGGDVIELKKRYLDIIRNLYDEFAEKFRVNFLEMFDYDFKQED